MEDDVMIDIIVQMTLSEYNSLADKGVGYDLTNDEHAAYFVGWIARCCWKVLQEEIYKDDK